MLRAFLLQILALTSVSAAATPSTEYSRSPAAAPGGPPHRYGPPHHGGCVVPSQDDADLLVKRWTTTLTKTDSDLGNSSQTWDYLLTDDFSLVSGSIQTLQQENVNGNYTIYAGKQTYIDNELKYGALYKGVHDLDIIAGCGRVVWYWQVDSVLAGIIKVRGVNIFSLNNDGKVTQLVVENDSLAFAINFGANVTFPAGP